MLAVAAPAGGGLGAARAEARVLQVRAVEAGHRTLLRISGPLDGVTTPALREAVHPYRAGSHWLILDLRAVEYIETPGLRLLLALGDQMRAGGGELRLVVPPRGRVERTLALVGLERQCAVFHSAREAWSGRPHGVAVRREPRDETTARTGGAGGKHENAA